MSPASYRTAPPRGTRNTLPHEESAVDHRGRRWTPADLPASTADGLLARAARAAGRGTRGACRLRVDRPLHGFDEALVRLGRCDEVARAVRRLALLERGVGV